MLSEITEILLKCELFENFSEEEIEPISALCRIENYQTGETVFRQGDRGDKMYIIENGQVTLRRSVDLGNRKASVIITILGPGRGFGCWAVLLGKSHNLMSSAICNKQTKIISMEGSSVRKVLKNNLRIGSKVFERLAALLGDRLRGVYGAMEKL